MPLSYVFSPLGIFTAALQFVVNMALTFADIFYPMVLRQLFPGFRPRVSFIVLPLAIIRPAYLR